MAYYYSFFKVEGLLMNTERRGKIMHLHFLHGFLGNPSDWNLFDNQFHNCTNHTYSIEDFLPQPDNEKIYFEEWANKFNKNIFSSNNFKNKKNILIGYSLGGRLALHSLALTNQWDAAIIISANPGLIKEEEKNFRIKNDETWAQRFLTEDWETLMNSWNAQSVFSCQTNNLIREEKLFSREKIVEILLGFSLGKQKNLRKYIKNLNTPILWIAGEKDTRFSMLALEGASLNKKITSLIFPNVGHRVPWENSHEFVKGCNSFISSLL